MKNYFRNIWNSLISTWKGMRLTGKHLRKKKRKNLAPVSAESYFKKNTDTVTIQYPKETIPVPDHGRYRLHMETEDCIGCDKCARICPVDCITIETFRAAESLGQTADGTVKRLHLPVFDIDMAKCMYCGLCTTVCPTECLTMTKVYDFSEFDRSNFTYHFGAMSPDEAKEKKEEAERLIAKQKEVKAQATPKKRKPVMRRAPAKKITNPTTEE